MQILNFNSKLAWVTTACVIWALLAQGNPLHFIWPELRLRMGWDQRVILVEGRLREVIEKQNMLILTVEAEPGKQRVMSHDGEELAQLPSDLEIRFVDPKARRTPLRISLISGRNEPRRMPNDRMEIGTERYVVNVSGGVIRIKNAPRPPPGQGRRGPEFRPGPRGGESRPDGPGPGDPPLRLRNGQPPPPPGDNDQRPPADDPERPPPPDGRRPRDRGGQQ